MNFVWLLFGQTPRCLEGDKAGVANFARQSDQTSAVAWSTILYLKTSSDGTAPSSAWILKAKVATFSSQCYECSEVHFPVWIVPH